MVTQKKKLLYQRDDDLLSWWISTTSSVDSPVHWPWSWSSSSSCSVFYLRLNLVVAKWHPIQVKQLNRHRSNDLPVSYLLSHLCYGTVLFLGVLCIGIPYFYDWKPGSSEQRALSDKCGSLYLTWWSSYFGFNSYNTNKNYCKTIHFSLLRKKTIC